MGLFIFIVVLSLLLGLFFYFGYRHDYRRNPKEFKRTLIAMPISIIASFLGIFGLDTSLRKWVDDSQNNDNHPTKRKQ